MGIIDELDRLRDHDEQVIGEFTVAHRHFELALNDVCEAFAMDDRHNRGVEPEDPTVMMQASGLDLRVSCVTSTQLQSTTIFCHIEDSKNLAVKIPVAVANTLRAQIAGMQLDLGVDGDELVTYITFVVRTKSVEVLIPGDDSVRYVAESVDPETAGQAFSQDIARRVGGGEPVTTGVRVQPHRLATLLAECNSYDQLQVAVNDQGLHFSGVLRRNEYVETPIIGSISGLAP